MDKVVEVTNTKTYILDLNNNSELKENNKIPWIKKVIRCNFCGAKLLIMNKARHERSKKHLDGVYLTTDRFEMI